MTVSSRFSRLSQFLLFIAAAVFQANAQPASHLPVSNLPHLERAGEDFRLIVDGKPFVIFGAELKNSSSSCVACMDPIWPRLAAIPLNTVLTPVYWEQLEPEEGKFDYSIVDGLLAGARKNNLRLVFLWFGSWKNGTSSHIPFWMKRDSVRFPRSVLRDGRRVEVLTPVCSASNKADSNAFAHLMRHLREVDSARHTVLMMQIENEVGLLGDSRDHSEFANKLFDGPVPAELISYLASHRDTLPENILALWRTSGFKNSGTWTEVFGTSKYTDELFMAWHYGRYINGVASAGKTEYRLPMYVNAWLSPKENPQPGKYPSGGPVFQVLQIWRAAGDGIDMHSTDDYHSDFSIPFQQFKIPGNPMFIPEARPVPEGEANVFYALGNGAFGFSPFGVDQWEDKDNVIGRSYRILGALASELFTGAQKPPMAGFVITTARPSTKVHVGDYDFEIQLDNLYYSHSKLGYGIIAQVGPDKLLGVGQGFNATLLPGKDGKIIGWGPVVEQEYTNGAWKTRRRLNGDETYQGQALRFPDGSISVERAFAYTY